MNLMSEAFQPVGECNSELWTHNLRNSDSSCEKGELLDFEATFDRSGGGFTFCVVVRILKLISESKSFRLPRF
jgi:hypothetical protein